jgi:hypothetical protein
MYVLRQIIESPFALPLYQKCVCSAFSVEGAGGTLKEEELSTISGAGKGEPEVVT